MALAKLQLRKTNNRDQEHSCKDSLSNSKKSKRRRRDKLDTNHLNMKWNHNYVLYMMLIWCFLFSYHATSANSPPINVSLGFVAPLDTSLGPLTILGNELEAAFKLAVDAVNKKPSKVRIRADFSGLIKDEGKNPSKSCKDIASKFHGDTKVIGIVGGYTSECSIAIQNELKSKNSKLPQISYRSQSISLLNKKNYPTFYRTSSNNKKEAQVIVDVIKHYRWSQAAIIHSNDEFYGKELSDEIVFRAKNSGIYIKERKSFSSDESRIKIEEKLQQIKASGSRINIIVAQGDDFFKIVKQIKAKRMYGEGWVWIATDGGTSLYLGSDNDVNITTDGFVGVAPEIIGGLTFYNLVIAWHETTSKEDFPGKIWRSKTDPSFSPYVAQVFRAVSAYHSILNELHDENKLTLKSTGSEIRSMVNDRLKTLTDIKKGVSSVLGKPIYFDDGMEGQPKFTIMNRNDGLFKKVGSWDESNSPRLSLSPGSITWPGGRSQTPTDKGTPGKSFFRIGFVSPTNQALGALADYGKELLSAFKVAVDMINKDDNYKIEIDSYYEDEGVDGEESCTAVAKKFKDLNLVAVVGAYRSQCTAQLHRVLGNDSIEIPIVSYASPSTILSDKNKYKYLFRISPSNKLQSEIIRQVFHHYDFKQVATLYSDEISSKEIAQDFERLMKNDTVPIVKSQQFPRDLEPMKLAEYVEKVKQSGARVIFVSALPNDIIKLEQIIREKGMAGKGWIWLGSDGATTNDFGENPELAKSMDGMLGVNPKHGKGAEYIKFLGKWLEKDKLMFPGIVHSAGVSWSLPYTAHVYDALNGIALALSDLVSRKSVSHKSTVMEIRKLLFDKLKSYDNSENGFISALDTDTKMYFDQNQDGPLKFDLVNLVDSKWRIVGKNTGEVVSIKGTFFPGGHLEPVVGAGKIGYEIAAFIPKDERLDDLADLGKSWEGALKAAVNWVNRNQSLTVGFKVIIYDTGLYANNCSTIAKNLPESIDIVIGAARSECTAAIYQQIKDRGIPMLSYASTSTVFSKKTNYPNLFRMSPSDEYQASALADFAERYMWTKLGIVSAFGIYGQELSADIRQQLGSKDIAVTATELFERRSKRMTKQLAKLKESGSAVNLMISNPHDGSKLYQEAFELGMVKAGWTWLGSDGAVSTMFKRSQNLQRNMQGMIGFRPKAGSGELFESIYNEWLRIDHSADRTIPYVAQLFDAVALPAFTLHQLHEENVVSSQISKINARGHLLRRLKSLQSPKHSFKSAIGKQMHFNAYQDVNAGYDLVNLNGNRWVTVGQYENGKLKVPSDVVWQGGSVNFPPSNQPSEQTDDEQESSSDDSGGTSQGLIVLAVVFSVFGLLVIVFMIYIVRRVRYRHLYMQSDLNQGGVFSVLYGHSVHRPSARSLSTLSTSTGHLKGKESTVESAIEVTDPMMPRHL